MGQTIADDFEEGTHAGCPPQVGVGDDPELRVQLRHGARQRAGEVRLRVAEVAREDGEAMQVEGMKVAA